MSTAEQLARLELRLDRLEELVKTLVAAVGKEAIPKGMCHKGFDLEDGDCETAGPYGYQRGCRGRSEDGERGCSPKNSAYYKEHPRGQTTPVAVRKSAPKNGTKPPAKKVAASAKKTTPSVRGTLFGRNK